MELTLKNVKVHADMSEETNCFSASIYIDGKKAGLAKNQGHGGPSFVDWTDVDLGLAYEKWLEDEVILCQDPSDPTKQMIITGEYCSKLEWMVDKAIETFLDKKWFKTKCRGKVLFRLKGDDDESWRTLKLRNGGKYTDETKEWMVKRYGDEIEEIANETRI